MRRAMEEGGLDTGLERARVSTAYIHLQLASSIE